MKFEIKNRWSGAMQYACELSAEVADKSYSVQLGFAVKKAVEESANLRGANLSDAYLSDAYLSDAYLSGANLSDANLSGAYLSGAYLGGAYLGGAYLGGAYLGGAYLGGANLSDANLSDANLSDANLSDANLSDANLSGANLRDAYLGGANLSGATLRTIRADFYDVLAWAPAEVPALIEALKSGRVDGSTYSGRCACLVGTIANVRGVDYETLDHDANRPIECFFSAIKEGDTHETNQVSSIALKWAEDWLASMKAAFAPKSI